VLGATYQPRAGIVKHDYVAWGFARRADAAGVDLLQGCEVTGFVTDGDRVTGVRTSLGDIAAGQVAMCAAGHTSVLTDMLGFRVPLQSHPLQALVSELLEPVHPTIVMSNAIHVYVSQAHKGELVMGAGIDSYNGYGQRGAFHIIERQMAAAVELFPIFARAHLLRTWGGIVDVTPDASPIIGRTPYRNLYLNCGWGTGGFKATPGIGWCLAESSAFLRRFVALRMDPRLSARLDPSDVVEIGEIAAKVRPGRTTPEQLTLYKSVGIAAQDWALGELVVSRARQHAAAPADDGECA
jgi:sarcosine oxidase subunit beta